MRSLWTLRQTHGIELPSTPLLLLENNVKRHGHLAVPTRYRPRIQVLGCRTAYLVMCRRACQKSLARAEYAQQILQTALAGPIQDDLSSIGFLRTINPAQSGHCWRSPNPVDLRRSRLSCVVSYVPALQDSKFFYCFGIWPFVQVPSWKMSSIECSTLLPGSHVPAR